MNATQLAHLIQRVTSGVFFSRPMPGSTPEQSECVGPQQSASSANLTPFAACVFARIRAGESRNRKVLSAQLPTQSRLFVYDNMWAAGSGMDEAGSMNLVLQGASGSPKVAGDLV
jgi:hypothetical protein